MKKGKYMKKHVSALPVWLMCCLFVFGINTVANAETLKYHYDELGRLTLVEDNKNGNRDYVYDAAGNRTSMVVVPVSDPVFSPGGGTFMGSVSVTLKSSTAGATIRYTTNGSNVTSSSPIYSSALVLSNSTTIKAKAFKSGIADSAQVTAVFTEVYPPAAMPTISPSGGSFVGSVSVSISTATAGATIRYTTNRTDVTESSPIYSGPILVTASTTIRAKAFKNEMLPSPQNSKHFGVAALPAPTGLSVRGPYSQYGDGYSFSWSAVSGAARYEVQLIGGARFTVTRTFGDSAGPRPDWVRAITSTGTPGHTAYFPR